MPSRHTWKRVPPPQDHGESPSPTRAAFTHMLRDKALLDSCAQQLLVLDCSRYFYNKKWKDLTEEEKEGWRFKALRHQHHLMMRGTPL